MKSGIMKMKTQTTGKDQPTWEDVTDSQKDWEDFWYNEDK